MFARVLTNAALVGGVLLGAVAVLATPVVVLGGAVFGGVVGALVGVWLREHAPGDAASKARTGWRCGLLVGAGVFGGSLALSGLVLLLGPASGAVLILLGAVAFAVWLGGRPDRRAAPQQQRPAMDEPGPPEPMAGPLSIPADLSIEQLCRAWQHTYFALLDLPAGASRAAIVQLRSGLLDELERRDPVGFSRWLDTGARAGSDPGRYLASDR